MIMLIDTLAERYGKLPTEVIRQASTFDVFIADTAIGYRNAKQAQASGNTPEYRPGSIPVEELMKIKEGRA